MIALGEKLDIHDLTHKIMEIKSLSSEALKLIVFQPNVQIKQIENFFREMDLVERQFDKHPTRVGLKPIDTSYNPRTQAVMNAEEGEEEGQAATETGYDEPEDGTLTPRTVQSDVTHTGETEPEQDEPDEAASQSSGVPENMEAVLQIRGGEKLYRKKKGGKSNGKGPKGKNYSPKKTAYA